MTTADRDGAKQRILTSSAQLFAENGIRAVSLADISQRAEVSKSVLYYHYLTKEQLVGEVCEIHMDHMLGKVRSWLCDVRDYADVKATFSELFDMLTDDAFHVKLHMALLSEASLGNTALQQLISTKYDEMGLYIDIASIRLNVKIHEMPHLKQMLFMALDGLMLHSLIGMDSVSSRQLLEKIYKNQE